MNSRRSRSALLLLVAGGSLAIGAAGCSNDESNIASVAPAQREKPATAWVEIGDELFELELALDPRTRFRGLGGRRFIAPNGGMLFVNQVARVGAMVMRDCPIPIDVAFLDDEGRVVATHEMQPEPSRRKAESQKTYEARLPIYSSGTPSRFTVETAGGRLAQLGVGIGDQLVFDTRSVLEQAGAPRAAP